jgi:uncharacterized protein
MKKLFLLSALLQSTLFASAQNAFLGIWEGKINVGVDIRMVFHFSKDGEDRYSVTLDSPDQGVKGIKASLVQLTADSVYVEISQFQAKYSGKLTGDSLITGMFTQIESAPLNFRKVTAVSQRIRPQTPVPPFPYKSEDLLYSNPNNSIRYGATITIPEGKGPFPAALLLTGSGQQNRDEEIMGHKPFAVIADHLTRNGFIVLRVDDRGMGQTTGDVWSATTRDFADDATVSINYLKTREEVDKKRMGLIGHSEGGMIAQIVAAERKDIDFVILLAGPGEKTIKLMADQNEAILTKAGLPARYIASYLELYQNILTTVLASDSASATSNAKTVVNTWIAKTADSIVVTTTGIKDEPTKENFVNQFAGQLNLPWFRYFLAYDPATNLKKTRAKILALNGEKDIQVIAKTNLAGIEAALKQRRSEDYEVKELPGLNHLFQECTSCSINEYGQLDQTISPVVLDTITKWMKKVL